MEIMCEYFDHGYKILFNFGDSGIRNGMELVNDVQGALTLHKNCLMGRSIERKITKYKMDTQKRENKISDLSKSEELRSIYMNKMK